MADKRMFSLKIVDSDLFLDMPLSSQCLYFHLSMRADDDGFVNNPKKIIKIIGANEDDLKILIAKGFVIVFEQGIIVITIKAGAKKGLSGRRQRRQNRLRAGAGRPRELAQAHPGRAFTLAIGLSDWAEPGGGENGAFMCAPFTPARRNESLVSKPVSSLPASQTQPRPDAFSLLFQEQIKGPENTSIARFLGFCCY